MESRIRVWWKIGKTYILTPTGHLLRKVDTAAEFNRIYEMVEPLYRENNGRPSADPVVSLKIVLLIHLYGLPYLQRAAEEVNWTCPFAVFWANTSAGNTTFFRGKL